jgi:hypothetical protein
MTRSPDKTALLEVFRMVTALSNRKSWPAFLALPRRAGAPAAALLAVLLCGLAGSDVRAQEAESTLLENVVVADGSLSAGGLSTTECFPIDNLMLGGVSFTVHTSHWQRRATSDSAWEDMPGTEETGQVCPLSPEEPGEYRMIIDGTVDGVRGMYRTNSFTKADAEPVPVLPGYAAAWLALLLAGLLARARRAALQP